MFIANGYILILKPIHGRQTHFAHSEMGNQLGGPWPFKDLATTWLNPLTREMKGYRLTWTLD